MPALEPLMGLRVVAAPGALDAAAWRGDGVLVLRSAPDEAFAIGASGADVADPDAIVEPETGFSGAWIEPSAVLPHIEWSLPAKRPALAQGSISGVPAKLWLADDGRALLVVQTAYAADIADRLGWTS